MSYPRCAKARRSFEDARKQRTKFACSISPQALGIWGIALAQKSRTGAGDRSRLGRNDSDDKTDHAKVRRRAIASITSKAICWKRISATATTSRLSVTFCTAKAKNRSRQLLKKTFRALKSGGTIAIAEWLVNDDRTEPLPSLDVRRANAGEHRKRRHFQLQRNQKLAGRSRFQKVRKARSARAFTANSGNKTVVMQSISDRIGAIAARIGFSSDALTCFHSDPMKEVKTKSRSQDQGAVDSKNIEGLQPVQQTCPSQRSVCESANRRKVVPRRAARVCKHSSTKQREKAAAVPKRAV